MLSEGERSRTGEGAHLSLLVSSWSALPATGPPGTRSPVGSQSPSSPSFPDRNTLREKKQFSDNSALGNFSSSYALEVPSPSHPSRKLLNPSLLPLTQFSYTQRFQQLIWVNKNTSAHFLITSWIFYYRFLPGNLFTPCSSNTNSPLLKGNYSNIPQAHIKDYLH